MDKDEYDELGAIIEQHPLGRPRGCHLCAAREARVAQLEAERDRLAKRCRLFEEQTNRLAAELATARRERDEARQLALQAHAAQEREDAARSETRRWAAEQVRAWWLHFGGAPYDNGLELADRIERGPGEGEG